MIDPCATFRARKCTSDACGLRFPVQAGSPLGERCPLCGAPTVFVDEPYPSHGVTASSQPGRRPLQALLDNIRSLRNVGSIFRTADGAGVGHLHLGGITPTPDHPKLAKTALGAQSSVPWTHHRDATGAARALREAGATLVAVEGGEGSRSLFDPAGWATELASAHSLVLVFGHEVSGVDPRITALCEHVVHLPMLGIKDSLNVSVAFGIVVYALQFGT